MSHPYLSNLSLSERAAHVLEAALSSRFAWIVLIYAAKHTDQSDVACSWLVCACPDPCSVSTKIAANIPEDELFVVVRRHTAPFSARAISFDSDLFVAADDAEPPTPDSFLGLQLGQLFAPSLDARKPARAARAPAR